MEIINSGDYQKRKNIVKILWIVIALSFIIASFFVTQINVILNLNIPLNKLQIYKYFLLAVGIGDLCWLPIFLKLNDKNRKKFRD